MNYKKRHDDAIDGLVDRLAKKPGFLFIKQRYHRNVDGQHYNGEMDVMLVKSNHREQYFRYYEVKGRDTPKGFEKAMEQFARHKAAYRDTKQNWNYIYYTPQRVERVRL